MRVAFEPLRKSSAVALSETPPVVLVEGGAERVSVTRCGLLGALLEIVSEPVGGAHRDTRHMAATLKRALNDALRQVVDLKPRELLQRRYERLQSYGRFSDTTER